MNWLDEKISEIDKLIYSSYYECGLSKEALGARIMSELCAEHCIVNEKQFDNDNQRLFELLDKCETIINKEKRQLPNSLKLKRLKRVI